MSDKWCCQLWPVLGNEMAASQIATLKALMEKTGLPESVFALQLRYLDGIVNACAYCGAILNPALTPKQAQQHKLNIDQAQKDISEPVKPVQKSRCAACGGRGVLGKDKNNVVINCMRCHGAGWFESKNVAVDPLAKLAQSKVDALREEKGIGEEPINVDAKGAE